MKQVIVVNKALGLPPGKLAAQVAHASVSSFLLAEPAEQQRWLDCGMPKIVLAGGSAEALKDLQALCEKRGVPAYLVRDAGKTILPADTITCLGIGPAESDVVDGMTGTFDLL